jgi:hypothetical protein
MPSSSYSFTWSTIASYASSLNGNNPPQTAPALTSPGAQLFPFAQQGSFDTSGGHHDAGDYSKYTINSASLVHYLMFAVDSLPGVAALDNLGIPESGDGISDVMQEAKWEADFICKLQDTDGGFYFLVYPKDREYEGNVTPDHGDAQVVWPKTTSVTAASVAALAQCASSPAVQTSLPSSGSALPAKSPARMAIPPQRHRQILARTALTRKSLTTGMTLRTTTNWRGRPAKCIWRLGTPLHTRSSWHGSTRVIPRLALGLVAHVAMLRACNPKLRVCAADRPGHRQPARCRVLIEVSGTDRRGG